MSCHCSTKGKPLQYSYTAQTLSSRGPGHNTLSTYSTGLSSSNAGKVEPINRRPPLGPANTPISVQDYKNTTVQWSSIALMVVPSSNSCWSENTTGVDSFSLVCNGTVGTCVVHFLLTNGSSEDWTFQCGMGGGMKRVGPTVSITRGKRTEIK